MTHSKKGFTLIELLIVIGILAVLATLTVLVLNPAELFKQARDSQRLADLDTIRDAIVFVQGTASTIPALSNCATSTGCSTAALAVACNTGVNAIYSTACTTDAGKSNAGTGWIKFDFTAGGTLSPAPIPQLPLDPSNTTALAYTYKSSGTLFKLGTVLESAKYLPMMANTADGGTASGMYELGTVMTAI